jgi:hypothetical protein
VILPDWRGRLHTGSAVTIPGGGADYPISVEGLNGFTGTVSFTVVKKDGHLGVSLPNIAAGATGAIRIDTDADIPLGTYTTHISGGAGKEFELVTIVRESMGGPVITSLSPAPVYPGETLHLYGYGFGAKGAVFLDKNELQTASWGDSELVLAVPDNTGSGSITVSNSE